MNRFLALAAGLLIVAACTSVETVRQTQGEGVKRTFRHSYAVVYQAALDSATRRKLEVVEQDRGSGRIVLTSGASWTSFGERIAIFVSRTTARLTTVEIVSKPIVPAVTFPRDWPPLLFGDIEQEVALARGTR